MTLAVFALAGGLVLAAGKAVEPATGVQAVTAESPCPVAACASGACHGASTTCRSPTAWPR